MGNSSLFSVMALSFPFLTLMPFPFAFMPLPSHFFVVSAIFPLFTQPPFMLTPFMAFSFYAISIMALSFHALSKMVVSIIAW
jgi:hypothetical protein